MMTTYTDTYDADDTDNDGDVDDIDDDGDVDDTDDDDGKSENRHHKV